MWDILHNGWTKIEFMVIKARIVLPSEERGMTGQGHEGTFWMTEMFCLDPGGSYTGKHTRKRSSSCIPEICAFYCMLYLDLENKTLHMSKSDNWLRLCKKSNAVGVGGSGGLLQTKKQHPNATYKP